MKKYHLELAGLSALLETPEEILIGERLRPFLCSPHEKPDCTIRVQPSATLPAFAEGGVWHGAEYYDMLGNTRRVFHCSAPGAAAFAVTQLEETGDVTLLVLPAYMSRFAGTSGIFNRIAMETLLLQHYGLLLHASLILYQGKAIAFTGPSGIGKSTQAALWQRCFGAEILNGDRAALRQQKTGWEAYGCPYAGTSGIYKNAHGPLTALVALGQGKENKLRRLSQAEAFRVVYPELTVHYWDKSFTAAAADLCLRLLQQVPVYLLECLPEESAAQLLKEGLML